MIKTMFFFICVAFLTVILASHTTAYFPVNQYVFLQSPTLGSNVQVFAEYATPTTSATDPEGDADPHYNALTTITDQETGITHTGAQDTCDTTNPSEYHELFVSLTGQVQVLGLGGPGQYGPLTTTAAIIKNTCPGNLICNQGTCPCGTETNVPSQYIIGPGTVGEILGLDVDNNIVVFSSEISAGTYALSFVDQNAPNQILTTLTQTASPNGKAMITFAYPNVVYVEQQGGVPGITVYNFAQQTLVNLDSINPTQGYFLDTVPDIDETGRYVVWQRTTGGFSSNIFFYDLGPDLVAASGDETGPLQLTTASPNIAYRTPKITLNGNDLYIVYQKFTQAGTSVVPGMIEGIGVNLLSLTMVGPYPIYQSPPLSSIWGYDVWHDKIAVNVYYNQQGNPLLGNRALYIRDIAQSAGNYGTQIITTQNHIAINKFEHDKILWMQTLYPQTSPMFNTLMMYDVPNGRITSPLANKLLSFLAYGDSIDINLNPSQGWEVYYLVNNGIPTILSPSISKTLLTFC